MRLLPHLHGAGDLLLRYLWRVSLHSRGMLRQPLLSWRQATGAPVTSAAWRRRYRVTRSIDIALYISAIAPASRKMIMGASE
jgi:hypothetical protein